MFELGTWLNTAIWISFVDRINFLTWIKYLRFIFDKGDRKLEPEDIYAIQQIKQLYAFSSV